MAQLFGLVVEIIADVGEGVSDHNKVKNKRKLLSKKNLQSLLYEIKGQIVQDIVIKQSKYLHNWHQRKLILSKTMLGFFNIDNGKNEPTEWINLNTIKNCSSKGEKIINGKKMYLLSFEGEDKHSQNKTFKFACDIPQKRDQWIKWINKKSSVWHQAKS